MDSLLLLYLARRDAVSAEERRILDDMFSRQRLVDAKQDIVREGDQPTESCMLLSGFAARYHLLADGKRQISAIHVPGDFVDLHSLLLGRMDHSVVAMSECSVSLVPHQILRRITETQPHLTRLLWLSTLIDAAIHRRWIVTSGRLPASGQLAHLFCEIYCRLSVVGLTDGLRFQFPISQIELGDALGLSSVHVNRTVKELRAQGLIRWHGSEVTILDWQGLQEYGQFDPTYLNLDVEPR
jgi:CRP-like cAMP-binding protein